MSGGYNKNGGAPKPVSGSGTSPGRSGKPGGRSKTANRGTPGNGANTGRRGVGGTGRSS